MGSWSSMVRTLPLEGRNRWFNSSRAHSKMTDKLIKPFCPYCKKEDALVPGCEIPGNWFCSKCGETVSDERVFRIIKFMRKEGME